LADRSEASILDSHVQRIHVRSASRQYTVVVGQGLLARSSSILSAAGLPAAAALVTTSRILAIARAPRITSGWFCRSDPHG
jgi:hypothetical protein